MNPLWSPDGRSILYCAMGDGPFCLLKAATPEGNPFPLPEIRVNHGGDRYRFLPDGKSLVLMQVDEKEVRCNFWQLNLTNGNRRQLTELRSGCDVRSFDVLPDGKQILFDLFRENSDVVLIDRAS